MYADDTQILEHTIPYPISVNQAMIHFNNLRAKCDWSLCPFHILVIEIRVPHNSKCIMYLHMYVHNISFSYYDIK